MSECEHEWHWWMTHNIEWEACQKCGSGRLYRTKQPIIMALTTLTADDGRPDTQLWMPARHVIESGP